MATHWAKPDSLAVSDEVAKKLLAAKGGLLAAFCDGSTHQIQAAIGAEGLKHLLDPRDGNVVDWDLLAPGRRNRPRQQRQEEADPRFNLPGKKESF